ncbi:uncharacterized protein LOC125705296 isoform X2 [Brienomyrus brachyistius]|nr:uncharacterized protein LOC125705296 isoform X2 [Brienomyrus brachyistius]
MSVSLIFVAPLVVNAEGVVLMSGSVTGITSTVVVSTTVCFVDIVNVTRVVSVFVCVVEEAEGVDVERISVTSRKDSVVGLTFSVVVSCAVMSGSFIFVTVLVVNAVGVVLVPGSVLGIASIVVVSALFCFVDSAEGVDVELIVVRSVRNPEVGLTFPVVVSCAVMSVSLIFVAPLVVNAEGVVLMSGSVAGITSTVVMSTTVCFVDIVNVTPVVSVFVCVVEEAEGVDVERIPVTSRKDSVVGLTFPVVVSCAVMSVSLIFVAPLVVNAEGVVLMSGSVAGITSTVVVSTSVCFVDSFNVTPVVSVFVCVVEGAEGVDVERIPVTSLKDSVVGLTFCFVDSVNVTYVVSVLVCFVEVSESIDVERIAVKSLKDSVVRLTFSVVVSCAVMSVSLIFVAPLVVNAEGVVLMSGSVAGITSTVVVSTSVCFVDSVKVTRVVSLLVCVVEVAEGFELLVVKSLKDLEVWLIFSVFVFSAVMSGGLVFVAPLEAKVLAMSV